MEHTALLAGREVKNGSIQSPTTTVTSMLTQQQNSDDKLQQLAVVHPGKYVSASRLTNLSKFRRDGGKRKVLIIFNALENKNLGTVSHRKNNRSNNLYAIIV